MTHAQKPLAKPPFIKRLLALCIDYCIILAYTGVLGAVVLVGYLFTGTIPNWLEHGVAVAELLGFLVLVLPVGLYLYLSESSARQATIGKWVMRLMVVSSASGGRASNMQIAVRTIVKLLPWEVAHFFVWHTVAAIRDGQDPFPLWLNIGLLSSSLIPVVYILVVGLQPKGRGPHDLVAGTRVVCAKRNEA